MSTETNTRYELNQAGEFVEVQETRSVIDHTFAIKRLVDEYNNTAPPAVRLSPNIGDKRFIASYNDNDNDCFLVKVLDNIKFKNIRVTPRESGSDNLELMPVFTSGGVPTGQTYTLQPFPDLRFVLIIPRNTYATHLFFQDRETGKNYQPLLPNIYHGGKLCFGTVPTPPMTQHHYQEFDQWCEDVYTAWENATWNADLADEAGRYREFLIFDDETGENVIPATPWQELSAGTISPSATMQTTLDKLYEKLKGASF